MDDEFFALLRRNVALLVDSFWRAGYVNVLAGSFVRGYPDYLAFRTLLGAPVEVYLVELLATKDVRDERRLTRAKRTSQEWRDRVDLIPEDVSIRQATGADYRYVGVDTSHLDVAATVEVIKAAIPEVYLDVAFTRED